jgi:trigger factor
MSPIAGVLSAEPVPLPAAKAPSLEGLAVQVPQAEDLTEEDLLLRFHEKKRALATVRERAEGERVELGDDVLLDTLGYAEGRLIPFSARFGLRMELAPLAALPGFAEAVAEGTVGGSVQALLELPDDYPVEPLRGMPVRFLIDIRAAREVKMPDETRPGFLEKLGLGGSFDEVMENIREELEDELADQLWVRAREQVLDEVARRTEVEVPRKLVDEEIRRRWAAAEGHAMVERNFDVDEQQEALQAWMTDAGTREEAGRRLRIGLALKAVAERDRLALTPEKLEALLVENAEPFGLTESDVKAALRESPETTRRLHDLGWYLMLVEHVMSKARVTFEGAEQG